MKQEPCHYTNASASASSSDALKNAPEVFRSMSGWSQCILPDGRMIFWVATIDNIRVQAQESNLVSGQIALHVVKW